MMKEAEEEMAYKCVINVIIFIHMYLYILFTTPFLLRNGDILTNHFLIK